MSEQLTALLVRLAALWCLVGLWALTIVFIFWDSRRRNLADRQRLRWLLSGLLPFVGFIAYLVAGRRTAPQEPRRVTMLHQPQVDGAQTDPPTIPAAYWRPVARRRQELTGQCTLLITQGPHAGRQVVLEAFPARIGRRADCAVHLPDDASVSRYHAEFYQQAGTIHLRDLGSSHGTTVNGSPASDQAVHIGDTVEVGQSTLVVEGGE